MNITSFLLLSTLYTVLSLGCASTSKKIVNRTHSSVGVANQKLGAQTVDHPENFVRVFAISDVHGMYDQTLLILKAGQVIDGDNNWLAGKSLLIVVGDSIDKGPQSIEVLDLWMHLQQKAQLAGGQLIHVLGNHEAEFLAEPNNKKSAELLNELIEKNIPVSDLTSSTTARGAFLHAEPVAARVGNWIFCHSGFYPDMSWSDFTDQSKKVLEVEDYENNFLIGPESILEMKDWEKDLNTRSLLLKRLDAIGIYGVVFGHQPKAFRIEGRSAAKESGRLVKIDNGMPPAKNFRIVVRFDQQAC